MINFKEIKYENYFSDISNELIYIGHLANHPIGNYHFEGAIDEVAIWDRALESSEVQALYAVPETINIVGLLIGVFIILIKKINLTYNQIIYRRL